jgi:peptidoglycan hydrolase-like protein with peptidoglycan-binding domain
VEELRNRVRSRALVTAIAVAAAIAVALGMAAGARAATTDSPGGASSGTSGSSTATSGTGTDGTTDDSGDDSGLSLGDRTLRRGMSGDDVTELQRALAKLGFRLRADGEYGTRTVRNVRRYERTQKLAVDGVVDPEEGQKLAGAAGQDTGASDATGTNANAPAGPEATLNPDGTATAPAGAPAAVQQIIAAGNEIADKPYSYGGGHTDDFQDSGYDCSGSVSYALHGANLLKAPLDSGEFMSWGESGPGQWVTIYANEGHMYMVVAGLRFDTSGRQITGTRWQDAKARSYAGFTVRHPVGL